MLRTAIPILCIALGAATGYEWQRRDCVASAATAAQHAADAAAAATTAARATEATNAAITRTAAHAHHNAAARLAAAPLPRRPPTLLGLRHPGHAADVDVPQVPRYPTDPDAHAADPLPVADCAAVERAAQTTTLMLVDLQRLLRATGAYTDPPD